MDDGFVKFGGAEGQTRTVDTGIFSAVLYHLSYLGLNIYYRIRRPSCQDDNSPGILNVCWY